MLLSDSRQFVFQTAIPINAPFAGVIKEVLVEDGTAVTSGMALFTISASGEGAAAPPTAETKAPPSQQPTPATPPDTESSGPIPTTPPVPASAAPPPPHQPVSTTSTESITPTPYKPPTSPPAVGAMPAGPPPGSQITGSRTEQRVSNSSVVITNVSFYGTKLVRFWQFR